MLLNTPHSRDINDFLIFLSYPEPQISMGIFGTSFADLFVKFIHTFIY